MSIQKDIQELIGWGFTQKRIADRLGVTQSYVCEIAAGAKGLVRPSHKLVTALRALHAEAVMGRQPARRPKGRA